MKFDGHIKLTAAALEKLKSNCPTLADGCNAPMFGEDARIWLGDDEASTVADNYSALVVNFSGHLLAPDIVYQVKLPDAVAFVDVYDLWTHFPRWFPSGQRFHFMRAPCESHVTAYDNACEFIRKHAEAWVLEAERAMADRPKLLDVEWWFETRSYVRSLASALHALQDSFSPGHTDRYFDCTMYGPSQKVPPIRAIHVYDDHNKVDHADHDYDAGSTQSTWGQHAIDASVALMTMGILSIPHHGAGLIGWDHFKSTWLAHELHEL